MIKARFKDFNWYTSEFPEAVSITSNGEWILLWDKNGKFLAALSSKYYAKVWDDKGEN